MIKISAKPISSPGRAEKYYPPPLMRFLRSNVGNKSRGRSRSSPLFVRKRNAATAMEAPEPSSPKVTCMGQVRVRRQTKKKRLRGSDCKRRNWIPDALFFSCCHGGGSCSSLRGKKKKKKTKKKNHRGRGCFRRPAWPKWTQFFRVGSTRKSEIREDRNDPDLGSSLEEEEEGEARSVCAAKAFACSSPANSPPRNALLLIRSRSAPYRSSSLASRFWGSPVGSEEETEERKQSTEQDSSLTSKRESSSFEEESDKESRLDPENEETRLGVFKDFEGSVESVVKERLMEQTAATKLEEEEEKVGEYAEAITSPPRRPVVLTRCKSEPARIAGEKLDPEVLELVGNAAGDNKATEIPIPEGGVEEFQFAVVMG
ncbi:unnamed protein product [Linum tenue]|uniref:Uncharacterized protein n=1 Tax=Linum tenue TaxID=586396 RepID=A0AAV0PMV7_9ROSI|nr:unnamed protein product [Linum tenue]